MNCDKSRELPLALIAFGISVYSLRSDNGIKRVVEGADPYTVNDNTHSKL